MERRKSEVSAAEAKILLGGESASSDKPEGRKPWFLDDGVSRREEPERARCPDSGPVGAVSGMRGVFSVFRAVFGRDAACPDTGSPLLNDERRRAGGGAGWLCALIGLSLFLLAGCEPIPKVKLSGEDQYPLIAGPIATVNFTPVHRALSCMRGKLSSRDEFKPIYVAVGNIKDLTGKMGVGETGAVVTRGASLMMISALGKMGGKIKLAERFDPSVANLEFDYISKRYLGDGSLHLIRDKTGAPRRVDWLPYTGGSVQKSDYYITGGITELNYNIYSGGAEFRIKGGGPKGRVFAMNVGADLRIVRTSTLEVVKAVSLQKQLVGYEAGVDLFRFFGSTLFEINAGEKVQEPMQLGVRTIMELGAIELISTVTKVSPDDCVKLATEWEKKEAKKEEGRAGEEGEDLKGPPVITEAGARTGLGRALASKAKEAASAPVEELPAPPVAPIPAAPEEKKPEEKKPVEAAPAPVEEPPAPPVAPIPAAPEEKKPGEKKPAETAPAPVEEPPVSPVAPIPAAPEEKEPGEKKPVEAAPLGKELCLQVAVFDVREQAERLVWKMRELGVGPARIVNRLVKGRERYLVQVYPLEAADAEAFIELLKQIGIADAYVVPRAAVPAPAEKAALSEEGPFDPDAERPAPDAADSASDEKELYLQVALFKFPSNAERLVWKMRELGVGPARIVSRLFKGRKRYLVQVHPLEAADAEAFIELLKQIGIADAYVAPRVPAR